MSVKGGSFTAMCLCLKHDSKGSGEVRFKFSKLGMLNNYTSHIAYFLCFGDSVVKIELHLH